MPETGQHVFGSTTLQAVQDFQRKRGLAVTGIVAWLELVRSWHGRPSENALHLCWDLVW